MEIYLMSYKKKCSFPKMGTKRSFKEKTPEKTAKIIKEKEKRRKEWLKWRI